MAWPPAVRGDGALVVDVAERQLAGALRRLRARELTRLREERQLVAVARGRGWSWPRIAACLVTSPDTLRRRYAGVEHTD